MYRNKYLKALVAHVMTEDAIERSCDGEDSALENLKVVVFEEVDAFMMNVLLFHYKLKEYVRDFYDLVYKTHKKLQDVDSDIEIVEAY